MVLRSEHYRRVLILLLIAGFSVPTGGDVAEIPEAPADTPAQRQFKTAEMADAVMGTAHSPEIEYVISPELQESLLGHRCSDGQCGSPAESRDPSISEPLLSAVIQVETVEMKNLSDAAKNHKVNCESQNESVSVHVLNASQDLMEFLNVNSSKCSLVLFYTTWCRFSASLAPHFNALPRLFPTLHFLALDASQHSSLSTRFGTVAVPNILLFQGAKPMARFNQTQRTLETLSSFITNQTGLEASTNSGYLEELSGPLAALPVKSIDWLLVFSVLFILGFSLYAILCMDSIRWLIPGQDHEHQE